MPLPRRGLQAVALTGGLMLAIAWPLSAYEYGAFLLPAAVVLGGVVAISLHRIEYGIATALALLPLLNVYVDLGRIGSIQPFKFSLPAIAAGLLIWAVLTVRRTEAPVRAAGLAAAVLGFLLVTTASAIFGAETSDSIGDLLQLVTGALLMLVTLEACRSRQQVLVVAGGLVLALLIASFHGIVQQATGEFSTAAGLVLEGEAVGRIAGSFGHPNQYAGFLAVLMPLAAAMGFTRGVSPALRILSLGAIALALPAISFAYTRGAVGALVGAAILWLAWTRRRSALALALAAIVALIAFAPSAFQERLESVEDNEVALRSDLWGSALDIYAAHPVLGVGYSNFDEGYAQLPSTVSAASQRRLLHKQQVLVPPHANNLYLTILAEEGVLGLLALLGIGAAALVLGTRAARSRDPVARALGAGLGAGTLVLALHSLLDVTLVPVFGPLVTLGAAVACYLAAAPSVTER